MAIDLRTLPAYLGDNATFQTWATGIDAQIKAVGLVQTSDTGQVDVTTATRPGTTSTYAGYRIYRFDDALQATKPVFIKLEYGTGPSAVDRPGLRVQLGTGTNGAGTLTGTTSAQRTAVPGASKTAGATLPSYCSGSTSRLSLVTNLEASATTFAMPVLIERTKTGAGVDTGDAVMFATASTFAGVAYVTMPFAGTVPTDATTWPQLPLIAGQRSLNGADVAFSPSIAFVGKPLFGSWCAYVHADLGELTAVPATHLGAAHTFMPLGDGLQNIAGIVGANHSIAILWE